MEIFVHAVHLHADEESIRAEISSSLDRFADRITRIDAYLTDVNGKKGGVDKRCVIEARPSGLQPLVAEDIGADPGSAVEGAASKLERVLDHHLGRLNDRR